MFDWFWDFLYSISKILFELVDALLAISNKLCGIEPITISGEKSNFMVELFENPRVFMGFAGAAIIGIFLLMIFSIIAICRNCKDGKKTSGQIAVEVMKTLGIFFLIPSLMIGFTLVLNELVLLLYRATSSSSVSLGDFLFINFCPEGIQGFEGGYDYTNTSSVRNFLAGAGYDLSDFRFFFSWIITLPILICVARALLLFVERCISIVFLFVMSPISLSTTVLDDGARFKLWRDKVITKFLSGYGMIIGLNIYIIVLSFITSPDVEFIIDFPIVSDALCNFLLRICFALGGAFFLPKIFGMVGDLFVQGAGSSEFQNANAATDGMVKTMHAIRKAVSDDDKKKKEKDKEDKANKEKLKSLRNGSGGSGLGGLGGLAGFGSGNANNNKLGILGKLAETGKNVVKAIAGIPNENQQNQNNNNNENDSDDSSNDFNDKLNKKSGLEKIGETAKNIIEKTGKVTAAVATGGKSNAIK